MPNESVLHSGPATHPSPSSGAADPGYEVRDTNIRAVLIFAVSVLVVVAVVQVALWGWLRSLHSDAPEPQSGPSMPATAAEDLLQVRALDDESRVRAVDRAMGLLVERGIPPVGAGKTEAQVNSHGGQVAPDAARARAADPNRPGQSRGRTGGPN